MRSRRRFLIVVFTVVLFGLGLSFSQDQVSVFSTEEIQGPTRPRALISQDPQEIGSVVFTEHGSKTYLGDNKWRYRSSIGEENTWNGTHYLRYDYDLENKQVSIGKLTFTHGANGVISVSHSESGSMIGALKWYAQYYLSDQWNNFTFDNYEYLGATKNDENATINQRWWSTNGELNVSYTYYYWNELKMRAKATNWAAQEVPVRVLWALTDIRPTGIEYSLIYDNGVAVGVDIGNKQTIFWHDVTETAPEININPILDKENRRAAVVFGNISSTLAQFETMDIDPTYTVAADIDEAYADYDPTWTLITAAPTFGIELDTVGGQDFRAYLRYYIDLASDLGVYEATLNIYEILDNYARTILIWRVAGDNWTTAPENLVAAPVCDGDQTDQFVTDNSGAPDSWVEMDATDVFLDFYNDAGYDADNYIGFYLNSSTDANGIWNAEDYQDGATHHSYVEVLYAAPEGEYNYVDIISDLHDPSDTGTHSDFAEMQDKDGTYDTLTESDTGGGSEWLDNNGHDGLYSNGDWTLTGSNYLYTQDQPTNIIETKIDGAYEGYFSFPDTSFTYGELTMNITAYGNADDGAGGDFCYFHWGHNGTYYQSSDFQFDTGYSYKTVTVAETFTPAEINSMQGWFEYDKSGGADEIRVDHLRLGISQSANYDLDLEVGWITADYDETNEELCIFGGTQGSEALRVDVWSGSWTNVFTDIAAGWNNISVTSYLTDATFEIRFTDTTNESVAADTWEVEAVLLHTWTSAGAEYTEYVYDIIQLSDSTTASMDASNTINEIITIYDSTSPNAGFSTVVYELIGMYETVTAGLTVILTIMEEIGFYETVSVGANFALTVLEVLGLAASVVVSRSAQVTIFENIGLFETVTTAQKIQFYMSETIGLSDLTTVAASYQTTVLETIGLTDLVTVGATYPITVLETIGLYDSTTTTQQAQYYINEIIGLTDLTGVVGGAEPDIGSMFYQLFLGLNMWGYLGPIALVIGGYFVAQRDKNLGVIWFMVECLVVAQYFLLVSATPDYWWHIFILLMGGLLTCVYPLWGKR